MQVYKPDQTIKSDEGKPRLTLVPPRIIYDIAEVREYGNRKYSDPESWRRVEIGRYRDAAFRHFLKYLDDPQGVDEESGISHLKHLACNIAFLCELEARNIGDCKYCKYYDVDADDEPCYLCAGGKEDNWEAK